MGKGKTTNVNFRLIVNVNGNFNCEEIGPMSQEAVKDMIRCRVNDWLQTLQQEPSMVNITRCDLHGIDLWKPPVQVFDPDATR